MGMSLIWGLVNGPECFIGLAPFLGLVSGLVSLIFRALSRIFYIDLKHMGLNPSTSNFPKSP